MYFYKTSDAQSLEKLKEKASVAIKICKRLVRDINEIIDDESKNAMQLISAKEWEIISSDDLSA
jgi:hypothetical protein